MADVRWSPGERFSYVMKKGGLACGTVIRVDGDRVVARLDCQKDDEEYTFHRSNPYFLKGEYYHV